MQHLILKAPCFACPHSVCNPPRMPWGSQSTQSLPAVKKQCSGSIDRGTVACAAMNLRVCCIAMKQSMSSHAVSHNFAYFRSTEKVPNNTPAKSDLLEEPIRRYPRFPRIPACWLAQQRPRDLRLSSTVLQSVYGSCVFSRWFMHATAGTYYKKACNTMVMKLLTHLC